jgi:hypothetical protein
MVPGHSLITPTRVKGPGMRPEMQDCESANRAAHARIFPCQQGTRYFLNQSLKTYTSFPLEPQAFALEQAAATRQGGTSLVGHRIEAPEITEARLEESLFAVPADDSPAPPKAQL